MCPVLDLRTPRELLPLESNMCCPYGLNGEGVDDWGLQFREILRPGRLRSSKRCSKLLWLDRASSIVPHCRAWGCGACVGASVPPQNHPQDQAWVGETHGSAVFPVVSVLIGDRLIMGPHHSHASQAMVPVQPGRRGMSTGSHRPEISFHANFHRNFRRNVRVFRCPPKQIYI